MNRCTICDYTVEEGSFLLNRSSHHHGVRERHGEFLCDECSAEIEEQEDFFNSQDADDEAS